MKKTKDYYKILGLSKSASAKEIKRAYRHLARKYHPDVNPGDRNSENRFKDIQEAYTILSDAKKRKMYDQVGFYADGFQPSSGRGTAGFDFSGFDFGRRGASSFSDIFSDLFRETHPPTAAPVRGEDRQYQVKLSFMDAIAGRTMRITVNRRAACQRCDGTGQVQSRGGDLCQLCHGTGQATRARGFLQFSATCKACGGTGHGALHSCADCNGQGLFQKSEMITVRVPPGVANGSRVRVSRKGDSGTKGAPPGDLYLVIDVAPHPFFKRQGNDILCELPITITEAALGKKIEVPTLDGKSLLRIPPGTQTGQKFRLRGKGVRSRRGHPPGDQIVEVRVTLPKISDERSREILREFALLNPENPRGSMGLV